MSRRRRKKSRRGTMRHLITQLNPFSPISEQYRTVRTNLDFASVDEELHSILVTSSGPSEGKSLTAANLAVAFAQQEKKVLLIDADLRKPTVHYTFQVNNLKGLSGLLVSDQPIEDVITKTDIENLDLITSGPLPPNPSELLGSKRMKTILSELKELYDVILFDTPPVLAVTDAQVLTNIVDGTILVIRSKQTEREGAMKAKELLAQSHAKLLGVVLNDVEKTKKNYYYYYGN